MGINMTKHFSLIQMLFSIVIAIIGLYLPKKLWEIVKEDME